MTGRRDGPETGAEQTLAGRSVLVVGPGSRLTRGIAHAARDRGASVAVASTGDVADTGDAALAWFSVTLNSEVDAGRLFDRAAALCPHLDTVVAVVAPEPLGAIDELSSESWAQRVARPLREAFWLVRRAVEGFLADAVDGRLVLVVEPLTGKNESNLVVETGLRSFARSFAHEYGRRSLACNLVLPGRSPTQVAPTRDPLLALIETALFLASPAASFINGEAVVVSCDSEPPVSDESA